MLVNSSNLDAINTAFITAVNATFGDHPAGTYDQFTTLVPVEGTSADIVVVSGVPALREWFGAKQFKDLRAQKLDVALRKWEKSIRLPIDEINGDRSGVLGERIADFVASSAYMYDSIVYTSLLANPTGYDGVSLMNNSHGNVGTGGTSDNLTTSALSFAEFRTGVEALEDMKDEAAEPLNVSPTHLLCGPAQRRAAMEITGSDRPVGISTTGAIATSGVTAGVTLQNFIGGSVSLIVSPRLTGNEWMLMDLSKGRRKPMMLAEFQAPRAVIKDQPDDDNVFYNDEALYSITAKATPTAGDWHLIYGSVTN